MPSSVKRKSLRSDIAHKDRDITDGTIVAAVSSVKAGMSAVALVTVRQLLQQIDISMHGASNGCGSRIATNHYTQVHLSFC